MGIEKMQARQIERCRYNGKPVKQFVLWKLDGDKWVNLGRHIAPEPIANKRLAKYAYEKMMEMEQCES